MAINQISTANTFEQWLIATQSLIAFANSITDAPSGGTFTANTAEYVITGNLTLGNTITCTTVNTAVIIFTDGTRLSSNVSIVNSYNHANGAFNKANSANVLAQAAYDYANTVSAISGYSGYSGVSGYSGISGYSGNSTSGYSGFSGISGYSGYSGVSGYSGFSGYSGPGANQSVNTSSDVQFDSLGVGISATGTTGEIRATDNITAYTSSDKRLKENIEEIQNALDKLLKISGVHFNWSDDYIKSHNGEDGYFIRKKDVGLIAQEIQEVLPEAVAQKQDGYLGLQYHKIIPLLVEAIKDINRRIDGFEQRIGK